MLIAPQQELNLLSTNVPDNTEPIYDGSATYNKGDRVQLNNKLYECQVDNTTGINPEDDPITWNYLGYVNKMAMFDAYMDSITTQNETCVSITINEDETDLIKVGDTLTGDTSGATGTVEAVYFNDINTIVFFSSTSGTFQTNETVNNGSASTTGTIQSINTTDNKPIVVSMSTSDIDVLALFGLTANAVRVTLEDSNNNIIYDSTQILVDYDISDWWEWTYIAPTYKKDVFFRISTMLYNATLKVYIFPTTELAKCAYITYGQSQDLGVSLYGAKVSYRSNSYKTRNSEGRVYLKKGISWKRAVIPVFIRETQIDTIEKRLKDIEGIPSLFIGDEREGGFESLLVFGFYKDLDIPISLTATTYEIEVESLG